MAARKTTRKTTKRKRATRNRARRMPATSRLPRVPRLSQGELLALEVARNPYKEAMLNPESGPLVGVPQMHPIDTHVVRVQSRKTVTITGGEGVFIANPVGAVSNDNATVIYFSGDDQIWGVTQAMLQDALKTNAPYSRAQFADGTAPTGSDVRARVVGYTLKVTNVSDDNSKNGTFTAYQEPAHHTLQGYNAAKAASKNEAKVISAKGSIALTYNVVDPSEAESWIWDPNDGYYGGILNTAGTVGGTSNFNPLLSSDPTAFVGTEGGDTVTTNPLPYDASERDGMPGYMGIWWNGTGSNAFLVEVHAIVEYIGGLVNQQVKPSAPIVDLPMMAETRRAVEAANIHVPVPGHAGSGHPHSALGMLGSAAGRIGHLLGQGAATVVGEEFGGPVGASVAQQLETQIERLGSRAVRSGIDYLRHMF